MLPTYLKTRQKEKASAALLCLVFGGSDYQHKDRISFTFLRMRVGGFTDALLHTQLSAALVTAAQLPPGQKKTQLVGLLNQAMAVADVICAASEEQQPDRNTVGQKRKHQDASSLGVAAAGVSPSEGAAAAADEATQHKKQKRRKRGAKNQNWEQRQQLHTAGQMGRAALAPTKAASNGNTAAHLAPGGNAQGKQQQQQQQQQPQQQQKQKQNSAASKQHQRRRGRSSKDSQHNQQQKQKQQKQQQKRKQQIQAPTVKQEKAAPTQPQQL